MYIWYIYTYKYIDVYHIVHTIDLCFSTKIMFSTPLFFCTPESLMRVHDDHTYIYICIRNSIYLYKCSDKTNFLLCSSKRTCTGYSNRCSRCSLRPGVRTLKYLSRRLHRRLASQGSIMHPLRRLAASITNSCQCLHEFVSIGQ